MSVCTRAAKPASTSVTAPIIPTRCRTSGAIRNRPCVRAIRYTPAVTMVAAWISAETGVGPAMASASQVCNGSCADLPTAPPSNINVTGDSGVANGQFLRCQHHQFTDVQRTQFTVQNEQREGQEYVTDAGHDERFHRCRTVSRMRVVETDQQVTAQTHTFPTEVHQQQVVCQYQNHHAGDKQVSVCEEARIPFFTAHVPGSEHVDEETDASDHRQHGHRQAVEG